MKTFKLTIGTPDGLLFEGDVERVMCRSLDGEMAILADHINFCTALGMGEAYIRLEDGTRRNAACIGGMITMMNGECHLLATTWEWEDEIDVERAKSAKTRAEEALRDSTLSEKEFKIAQAKLNRALVRLSVRNQL